LAVHAFSVHNPLGVQQLEGGNNHIVVDSPEESGRFDLLVNSMPEVRVVSQPPEMMPCVDDQGDVESQLMELKNTVRVLQTSYAVSLLLVICHFA
jgi:hypothetical protein